MLGERQHAHQQAQVEGRRRHLPGRLRCRPMRPAAQLAACCDSAAVLRRMLAPLAFCCWTGNLRPAVAAARLADNNEQAAQFIYHFSAWPGRQGHRQESRSAAAPTALGLPGSKRHDVRLDGPETSPQQLRPGPWQVSKWTCCLSSHRSAPAIQPRTAAPLCRFCPSPGAASPLGNGGRGRPAAR